jgi:hypothetical protein
MRLTTIALACGVTLSCTLAFADEACLKGVSAYHAYKGSAPVASVVLRPNYGNPNSNADGPTTLSGTGSSSFGGSEPGTSGRN